MGDWLMNELLKFARAVAYNMWNDPEAGSIAGIALWRAMMSYDASKNVPLKRWIARRIKTTIWYRWRQKANRKEELHSEFWWEQVYEAPEESDLDIEAVDYRILVERYIHKWPWDVVAKRYNCNIKAAKELVAGAEHRLRNAVIANRKACEE
jgi:DNA-directed RNA polymerase specialized sigma24 family protein